MRNLRVSYRFDAVKVLLDKVSLYLPLIPILLHLLLFLLQLLSLLISFLLSRSLYLPIYLSAFSPFSLNVNVAPDLLTPNPIQ